ncbi:OmpP1/FadL family transporter [Alkanindiges illinoisensis]|uniref:OmpP1/FadL family transporter n=1 Tax=Alkanindiges illinoisensis TaxID=197183 RepID=UPI000556E3C6|nr:outer membrane protein transport protein [Alkanindiges illinoisensis]
MFSKKSTLAVCITAALTGATGSAFAAAFQLNYQSTGAIALANAGRATLTDDASVVYTNPAGISRLDGQQVSANVSGVFPKTDITYPSAVTNPVAAIGGAQINLGGTAEGDAVEDSVLASAFWAIPNIGVEGLSAGLGFYQPFGFNADYENSYIGRYWGDKTELAVLTLQPSVSYAIDDTLSLGAGVTINYADGKLTRRMLAPLDVLYPVQGLNPNNGLQSLIGDDVAYGWNFGALWDITPELHLGAVYRSEVDYDLEGSVRFSNVDAALGLPFTTGQYDASLSLTTPESYEVSATYDVSPTTKLHGTWMRTNWSSAKTLPISIQGTAVGTFNTAETLGYDDTNLYAVGVSWQQTDRLGLKAGFAVDEAVAGLHPSARIPTAKRYLHTIGANYMFNPKTSIDLAYIYAHEDKAHVSATNADSGTYNATFQNRANIISAQLNYKF